MPHWGTHCFSTDGRTQFSSHDHVESLDVKLYPRSTCRMALQPTFGFHVSCLCVQVSIMLDSGDNRKFEFHVHVCNKYASATNGMEGTTKVVLVNCLDPAEGDTRCISSACLTKLN